MKIQYKIQPLHLIRFSYKAKGKQACSKEMAEYRIKLCFRSVFYVSKGHRKAPSNSEILSSPIIIKEIEQTGVVKVTFSKNVMCNMRMPFKRKFTLKENNTSNLMHTTCSVFLCCISIFLICSFYLEVQL